MSDTLTIGLGWDGTTDHPINDDGGQGGGLAWESSYDTATLQMLLGEGEVLGLVDGLKSIYLDGTPIQNSDGSHNFKGIALALVAGTNTQAAVGGIAGQENPVSVNVQATHATPVTRTIATAPSAIRVRVAIPVLKIINTTTGNSIGNSAQVKIERQNASYNGGAWEQVTLENDGVIGGGPFSTKFTKGFRVDLPPSASPWQVRLSRISADDVDVYHMSQTWWEDYTEIVDARMRYPNSAVLSMRVNGKQFRSIPKVSCDLYGIKIQVPTNYTPASQDPATGVWTAATYATTGPGTSGGAWDGTFKTAWCSNPAWVFFDAATKTRYGCGNFITASGLDKWSLYTIAQWCDAMVADGKGGTEPRMVCNLYMQNTVNAIKALQQLASIFFGVVSYIGGAITPVADTDASPVALFTNANVVGGRFNYEGTARTARHTVAIVSFLNPELGWTSDTAVYEDVAGLARYGYNPLDLTALGATSQGQALRLAKWAILTELMSPETVGFSTGLDGSVCRPGDVIQVSDQFRAGKVREGGRVGPGATTTSIPLDAPVTIAAGTYYLKIKNSAGVVESRTVSTAPGTASSLSVSSPFSEAPPSGAVWLLQAGATASLYRVISVRQGEGLTHDVVALLHAPEKYALLALASGDVVPRPTVTQEHKEPTGLTVSVAQRILSDRQALSIEASWTDDGASSYIAVASRDLGPWNTMSVSGASAVLEGVAPGGWRVRVAAVWPYGVSPAAEASVTVTSSSTPPVFTSDALAALTTIASDSVLSRGEKPGIITEFSVAQADFALLSAKATATSTPYSAYATAWSNLQAYILGINPAYNDTTQDSVVDPATWQTVWGDFYRENTALVVKLAGAPPSTADTIATSNLNLTTNASAPIVDGVTLSAGNLVVAAGQTTKAENAVYQVGYTPPAGGSNYYYPSSSSASGTNYGHTNAANAYDGTTSAPTDGTYSSLTSSANGTAAGSATVIYSGWTGTLTGTLYIKVTPRIYDQVDGYGSTANAYYSTDNGSTWTLAGSWDSTHSDVMRTLSVALSGVDGTKLKVKITTTSYIPQVENPTPPPFTIPGAVAIGAVDINSIAFYVPAVGGGNYFFTQVASVFDGMLWRARSGSTYGGKVYTVSVAADNGFTLTAQAYDAGSYDVPIFFPGKPGAGQTVFAMTATRPFTLAASGHQGGAGVANTTNPKDFAVYKGVTQIGTLRFGAAGAFSVQSFTSTAFATGDVLKVTGPAAQDATLADINLLLRGFLG